MSTTTIPFRLRLRTIPPSNSCTRQSQLRHAYNILQGHKPDKMPAAANIVHAINDSPYWLPGVTPFCANFCSHKVKPGLAAGQP